MRLPLIVALLWAGTASADDLADALAEQIHPEGEAEVVAAAHELARRTLDDLMTESPEEARQHGTRDRLAEACVNLYASAPDETITNPLCYEVFLANGLPD